MRSCLKFYGKSIEQIARTDGDAAPCKSLVPQLSELCLWTSSGRDPDPPPSCIGKGMQTDQNPVAVIEPNAPPPPLPGGGDGQKTLAEEMQLAIQMQSRVSNLQKMVGAAFALVFILIIAMAMSGDNATLEKEMQDLRDASSGAAANGRGPTAARVAGVPQPVGSSPDFCFGAQSSATLVETFSDLSSSEAGGQDFSNSRWRIVDDDPISEPGNWVSFQHGASAGGFAGNPDNVYGGPNPSKPGTVDAPFQVG